MDMRSRGLSTAIDVALCVLLIGASVATLSVATPPTDRTGPDATDLAILVATSTDTTLPGDDHEGTLAERLADAAVGAATMSPTDSTATAPARVNASIVALPEHVHLIAVWQPYPGAPIEGRVTVGERPPPPASVNTARITVPLGTTVPTTTLVSRARTGGYAALATTVARAIYRRLEHPCEGPASLRTPRCHDSSGGDTPVSVDRLAARIERDLRHRSSTPVAAARTLSIDEVTLVVRRWTV